MLVKSPKERIKVRSTKKLNEKGVARITEQIRTFDEIGRYERRKEPKRGKRTFSYCSLIVFCIYLEMKGLTYDGDVSQNKLKAMGMPRGRKGYLRPSPARISYFIKHEWPEMEAAVSGEYVEAILASLPDKEFTVDSTPMEASRYSKRYHYSPHYEIRMGKCHIIMCCGYPLVCTFTNANDSDCQELPKLLGLLPDKISGVRQFTSDGSYPAFYNYSDVFDKLGVVMASNPSVDSVFHDNRSMDYIENLYASFWKDQKYRPKAKPSYMFKFLIDRGKEEVVGQFFRNLDMYRGKRISAQYAKDRHICETIHRAMKRWMNFDVRGLRKESDLERKKFKFFTAQVLCAIFDPYYEPEQRSDRLDEKGRVPPLLVTV